MLEENNERQLRLNSCCHHTKGIQCKSWNFNSHSKHHKAGSAEEQEKGTWINQRSWTTLTLYCNSSNMEQQRKTQHKESAQTHTQKEDKIHKPSESPTHWSPCRSQNRLAPFGSWRPDTKPAGQQKTKRCKKQKKDIMSVILWKIIIILSHLFSKNKFNSKKIR